MSLGTRTDGTVPTVTVVAPPLSQAVGYVVVVVIGLVIAFGKSMWSHRQISGPFTDDCLGMIFVTKVLKSAVNEDNSKTEM
jgi:urea-proton symporter